MKENKFNPGFRLSLLDVIVLILGCVLAYYLREINVNMSCIVLFVVGHFFYFCNVVRMSRIPELIWASCFVLLCGVSQYYHAVTIDKIFVFSLVITVILTYKEMRKPFYHGIFWSKINPNLEDWFHKHSKP